MPFTTYRQSEMGRVTIDPAGPFEAGSVQTLTLTYTAGRFGIDDTGGIKVGYRQASDMARFQTTDPAAPNYCSAVASNGAKLVVTAGRFLQRPWANALWVQVARGFLRPGETVTITLGDRSGGSPGIRLQTAAEKAFPLKVFVDAFATYSFCEVPGSPVIDLVPGKAVKARLILTGARQMGEPFRMGMVAQDRWSNPTGDVSGRFSLTANLPVTGLPEMIDIAAGELPRAIEDLRCTAQGVLEIQMRDAAGALFATSNPMRIAESLPKRLYWTDLHAQSGETVGSGTARDYFAYGRDKAFIEACAHQGNDFQITDAFWAHLNELSAEFNEPGRYVVLPGYEWSANTGLGGDHNVLFPTEGAPIRRSSHILVPGTDEASVCPHINDLLAAFKDQDVLMMAHVGGRYADIAQGHDGRLVRAVEVHSSWGTFEWLLHDALALGHRPGIVCNSDDHKGRPGLTTPGAGVFGAMGGLTAYAMPELSRTALVAAIRKRSCYGTTGARILVETQAEFEQAAEVYDDDPALGPTGSRQDRFAGMGEVARAAGGALTLRAHVHGTAPIERLDLFDGTTCLASFTAPVPADSRRIRVLWQGAEYRGRGRETVWDGKASLQGAHASRVAAVNFLNPDRRIVAQDGGTSFAWRSVTTGNRAGLDLWLDDAKAGRIQVRTEPARLDAAIGDIGAEGLMVEAGGLDRKLSVQRLPEAGGPMDMEASHTMTPGSTGHALYWRVTQEDGHQAWTSPLYLLGQE